MVALFTQKDPKILELRQLPLFADAGLGELEDVARFTDEVSFGTGAVLTREGRPGHECFLITEGRGDVRIAGRVIGHFGPGDLVGEMALLEMEPRVATVVARSPVRALVMTQQSFNALLDRCSRLTVHVMRSLAERLRDVQSSDAA